jgi:drug/metabolite transporter (DMT)-like permease
MNPAAARGAALLVAAMACFSASDALAKQLSGALPPLVLAWCRYLLLLAVVAPLALRHPAAWRSQRPGLQVLRAAALAASAMLFLFGISLLPVAEATAMVFASPLFVTLLASLALREHVPLSRWWPVLLGFGGVLVVVRPGAGVFGAAALYPLLSSMAWACAVICTRRLSSSDSTLTTMLYSSVIGTAASTLLLPSVQPGALLAHAWPLLCMAGAWCLAQWLTIVAYRLAPAAAIAPFAYTQLLCAALIGWVVFDHLPDGASFAGMAVILASGVWAAGAARRA